MYCLLSNLVEKQNISKGSVRWWAHNTKSQIHLASKQQYFSSLRPICRQHNKILQDLSSSYWCKLDQAFQTIIWQQNNIFPFIFKHIFPHLYQRAGAGWEGPMSVSVIIRLFPQRHTPNRMDKHDSVEFFLIFLHMQTINSSLSTIPAGCCRVILVMHHTLPWTRLHHLFARSKWNNIEKTYNFS